MKRFPEKYWKKGYLVNRICPIYIHDPSGDNIMKPRLWGYFTWWFVLQYCIYVYQGFPFWVED